MAVAATTAIADQVIITALQSNGQITPCPEFCETSPAGTWYPFNSTIHSTAAGDLAGGSVFAPGPVAGTPSCSVSPVLQISNAVYAVDVTHSSVNCSTNIIISLSASGGTLSTNQTDGFQASHGVNLWYFIGFLTNNSYTPVINFTYASGTLTNTGGRWYVDGFRFTALAAPCEQVPQISTVNYPLAPAQTFVSVPNIATSSSNVTVYEDTGAGSSLTQIGSLAVTNTTYAVVPVTALVDGNYISATQWHGGQESCPLAPGTGKQVSFNNISSVPISITYDGTNAVLNWSGRHVLQFSISPTDGFTDVPGPVLGGPFTNAPGDAPIFYRLKN